MEDRIHMDVDPPEEEVEEYDENADEDFNPDKAVADEQTSSSSEDENDAPKAPTKARKRNANAFEDLDSGDEATIKERKRKKRKSTDPAEVEEDSAGEGGLIRTRAQRLAEKVERKQQRKATSGEVTIDVDQIWTDLSSVPVGRLLPVPSQAPEVQDLDDEQNKEKESAQSEQEELITIKRRIEYAGEATEVEEQVPRSSKEAQRYLQEHPEADPNYKPPETSDLRRPLKRPSLFEPNPTGAVKGVAPERLRPRAPSRMDVLLAEKRVEEEQRKKAEKMTTVQKSALDWKGYVDREGLRDELDEYGKSKRGYLAREEFLGRADLLREEAARTARLKGRS